MNFKHNLLSKIKKHRKDSSGFFLTQIEYSSLNDLCQLANYLDKLNAIPATSSNFSLRANENSFFISKSGVHKRNLNPSLFVRVDLNGVPLSITSPKPSDETLLHAIIYKRYPEAKVVAHCHAREFEVFKTPQHIFPGHELLKALGLKSHEECFTLPVFKNSQDISALSKEVESYLLQNKSHTIGFMIEKHGIYCLGKSVQQVQNFLEALFHLVVVL
jgi:methylthioribulose-1-phosphate dehydratase